MKIKNNIQGIQKTNKDAVNNIFNEIHAFKNNSLPPVNFCLHVITQ